MRSLITENSVQLTHVCVDEDFSIVFCCFDTYDLALAFELTQTHLLLMVDKANQAIHA